MLKLKNDVSQITNNNNNNKYATMNFKFNSGFCKHKNMILYRTSFLKKKLQQKSSVFHLK